MSKSIRTAIATLAVSAALAVPAFAAMETYGIDRTHSDVNFKIRHLVSKVMGTFDAFTGEIRFDAADYSTGSVNFEIEAASINTKNTDRDNHLKSPDFFDVEKNPKITFKSTKITVKSPTELAVTGDLTMRGVTKPVTLAVGIGGFMTDPWGNEKAGFEVTGKLNRKDFGILWNKDLDKGGTLLGDDVEVVINLEAAKMKAAEKK